jgi:hypothetical protein
MMYERMADQGYYNGRTQPQCSAYVHGRIRHQRRNRGSDVLSHRQDGSGKRSRKKLRINGICHMAATHAANAITHLHGITYILRQPSRHEVTRQTIAAIRTSTYQTNPRRNRRDIVRDANISHVNRMGTRRCRNRLERKSGPSSKERRDREGQPNPIRNNPQISLDKRDTSSNRTKAGQTMAGREMDSDATTKHDQTKPHETETNETNLNQRKHNAWDCPPTDRTLLAKWLSQTVQSRRPCNLPRMWRSTRNKTPLTLDASNFRLYAVSPMEIWRTSITPINS